MKEYDIVELIKDRAEYARRGVTTGAKGIILGGERSGYFLVYFYGEKYLSPEDVELYHEIDVGVRTEDLEVIYGS